MALPRSTEAYSPLCQMSPLLQSPRHLQLFLGAAKLSRPRDLRGLKHFRSPFCASVVVLEASTKEQQEAPPMYKLGVLKVGQKAINPTLLDILENVHIGARSARRKRPTP
jgi:hypothetical protein